jgi:hypothetical protein
MTDDDIPILSEPPPEHWDEAFAKALIGKTILVGLTFLDADGALEERQQMFGVVIDADAHEGILLDLLGEHDGDAYSLPPQTSAILAAEPGVTSLAGDKPDFVANWTIHGPPDEPANDEA